MGYGSAWTGKSRLVRAGEVRCGKLRSGIVWRSKARQFIVVVTNEDTVTKVQENKNGKDKRSSGNHNSTVED